MKIEPTERDWARLAAYIDSEGCICIASSRGDTKKATRRYKLEVTVANSDYRLAEWIRDTFGGRSKIQTPKSSQLVGRTINTHKSLHVWISSAQQAGQILRGCLTHFIIKREQAELAIRLCELSATGVNGKRVTPEVLAERESLFTQSKFLKRNPPHGLIPNIVLRRYLNGESTSCV